MVLQKQHDTICAHQWPLWAKWWWLGLPHHGHILHASLSLTVMKNTYIKKTYARTQPNILELKALGRFCGASDTSELLWQMLYDQFFSSLSEPGSVQLLSSEAGPHYFSTTRESFPPFPGELWQLLYPLCALSPYCGQHRRETESGSDQPSSRRVCNASSAICCGRCFLPGLAAYEPKPIHVCGINAPLIYLMHCHWLMSIQTSDAWGFCHKSIIQAPNRECFT